MGRIMDVETEPSGVDVCVDYMAKWEGSTQTHINKHAGDITPWLMYAWYVWNVPKGEEGRSERERERESK